MAKHVCVCGWGLTWQAILMRKLTTVSVCCFSTGLLCMLSVPGMDWLRPNTYKHKHYNLSNIDKLFSFLTKEWLQKVVKRQKCCTKGFSVYKEEAPATISLITFLSLSRNKFWQVKKTHFYLDITRRGTKNRNYNKSTNIYYNNL